MKKPTTIWELENALYEVSYRLNDEELEKLCMTYTILLERHKWFIRFIVLYAFFTGLLIGRII